MKAHSLIIMICFSASPLWAQTTSTQVVATGGGTGSSSGLQYAFTIGEVAIQYYASGTLVADQGFQKPNPLFGNAFRISLEENTLLERVMVYPNPASDILKINLSDVGHTSVSAIRLLDTHGSLYQQIDPTNNVLDLDLKGLSAGVYVLQIGQEDGTMISYKIVKLDP